MSCLSLRYSICDQIFHTITLVRFVAQPDLPFYNVFPREGQKFSDEVLEGNKTKDFKKTTNFPNIFTSISDNFSDFQSKLHQGDVHLFD